MFPDVRNNTRFLSRPVSYRLPVPVMQLSESKVNPNRKEMLLATKLPLPISFLSSP